MNRVAAIFRALKYRNFRLFFPGLMVAQIGIWIQNISISWVVYDMTKSPFIMGTIMFLGALPLFLLTPFAGVLIDKFSKHKLLMLIQILYMIQAFLISALTLSHHVQLWSITLLAVFLNIIAAVDGPLRQSMYVDLVDDKHDLGNAIALNATCFNVARLVGPAVAGVLLATVGAGMCFFINFLCFIPVTILVALLRFKEEKSGNIQNETILEGLFEGVDYVSKSPSIAILLVYIALISFLAMTYPMLMPIYTTEVLHENAKTLGLLMSVAGVGALMTSLVLAAKSTIRGLNILLALASLFFGAGFVMLGVTHTETIALAAMFLIWLGTIGALTPASTLLQSVVNNDMRGRVMSLHFICYLGTLSISNFFAGSITHALGISKALVVLGAVLTVISFIFLNKLRKINYVPVYEKEDNN